MACQLVVIAAGASIKDRDCNTILRQMPVLDSLLNLNQIRLRLLFIILGFDDAFWKSNVHPLIYPEYTYKACRRTVSCVINGHLAQHLSLGT